MSEFLAEQMLADVRAVVFDLDGTLLDRRRSFERFVRDQRERFAYALQAVEPEQYVRTLVELDRDGYGPRRELFTGMIEQFELPATLAETLLNDYRAGFPSACLLFPDATRTLSSLRAFGLKLGLITNGSVRMQSRKLECIRLAYIYLAEHDADMALTLMRSALLTFIQHHKSRRELTSGRSAPASGRH